MDNIIDFSKPKTPDEPKGPPTFDYKFEMAVGYEFVSHGFLILTSAFAATGMGLEGEIIDMVPMSELRAVRKVA